MESTSGLDIHAHLKITTRSLLWTSALLSENNVFAERRDTLSLPRASRESLKSGRKAPV